MLENFCGGCWNRVCRWVDVIIMNTEEKYWDAERFEPLFEGEDTKLTVCHICQSEFDHGRTRHEGILKSDADVCICMTHDCVPYDRNLVKELLEALDASGTCGGSICEAASGGGLRCD